MARLVRALLGDSAVACHKVAFGATLVCLGILITPRMHSFRCELETGKAAKCSSVIEVALRDGILYPGTARKLAGRLGWASQFLFRKLGRAMLRPLFQRAHSSECLLDDALKTALAWWLKVLSMGVAEEYPWAVPNDRPAHLYVDAQGVPPRWAHVSRFPRSCILLLYAGQVCCRPLCAWPGFLH